MYSFKSTTLSVLLATWAAQSYGQTVITPMLGVSNPSVDSAQKADTNAICGNHANLASVVSSSQSVLANADGTFLVTAHSFNTGSQGSRQVSVKVDATSEGKDFVNAAVSPSHNGNANPDNLYEESILVSLPENTVCSGGQSKDLCLASFTTSAGYSNCVVVRQDRTVTSPKIKARWGKANANAAATAQANAMNSHMMMMNHHMAPPPMAHHMMANTAQAKAQADAAAKAQADATAKAQADATAKAQADATAKAQADAAAKAQADAAAKAQADAAAKAQADATAKAQADAAAAQAKATAEASANADASAKTDTTTNNYDGSITKTESSSSASSHASASSSCSGVGCVPDKVVAKADANASIGPDGKAVANADAKATTGGSYKRFIPVGTRAARAMRRSESRATS